MPRCVPGKHVSIRVVESAFYEQVSPDSYLSTPATAGPWSVGAQHGGPPSALAARALELHEPDQGQRLARVAVDILRPVPIGKLSLRTRTVRPGRRVALLETVMESDGREVLHARGWRVERPAGPVPEVTDGRPAEPVPPESDGPPPEIFVSRPDGYLSMIEWRFLPSGGGLAVREGPAGLEAEVRRAWARSRIPVLAGEEPTPMMRTLLVADSGSGLGAALPPSGFIFINVDLTVVTERDQAGEWLLLEASTVIGADGTGLATTRLADPGGSCGQAMQTLLVAPR